LVTAMTLLVTVACANAATPTPTATQVLPGPQNDTEAIGIVQDALDAYSTVSTVNFSGEPINCRAWVLLAVEQWEVEEVEPGRWRVLASMGDQRLGAFIRRGELGTPSTVLPLPPYKVIGEWELQPSGVVTTLHGEC